MSEPSKYLKKFFQKISKNALPDKNELCDKSDDLTLTAETKSEEKGNHKLREILTAHGVDLSVKPSLNSYALFNQENFLHDVNIIDQSRDILAQKIIKHMKPNADDSLSCLERVAYFKKMKDEIMKTSREKNINQIIGYNTVIQKETEIDKLLELENDEVAETDYFNGDQQPALITDEEQDSFSKESQNDFGDDSLDEEELIANDQESSLNQASESEQDELSQNNENICNAEVSSNEDDQIFDQQELVENDLVALCSGKFDSQIIESNQRKLPYLEFIENEAEVSGSDIQSSDDEFSSNEDENQKLMDDMLAKPEELAELPENSVLQNEIAKNHNVKMLREDSKRLNMLKNRFIENGDLYDDFRELQSDIAMRKRFRWNISSNRYAEYDKDSTEKKWYMDSDDDRDSCDEDKMQSSFEKESLTPLEKIEKTLQKSCSKFFRSNSQCSSSQDIMAGGTCLPTSRELLKQSSSEELLKIIDGKSGAINFSSSADSAKHIHNDANLTTERSFDVGKSTGSFLRLAGNFFPLKLDKEDSSNSYVPDCVAPRSAVFETKAYANNSNDSSQGPSFYDKEPNLTSFSHPEVKKSLLKMLQKR